MALAAPVRAGVTVSHDTFAAFPSVSEFQLFNPHDLATPTGAERTVRENVDTTRFITQSFQLGSSLTLSEIDLLFVRGGSGNAGILQIFSVADALAGDLTADYNNAVANGFLLNIQFTMPGGLDISDNTERTLVLGLDGAEAVTLPAGSYALSVSSVVDGDTLVNNEIFTWRFGDPGSGSTGWYADGRVYYDDFVSSGSTETRRDALFAFNPVPEPATATLVGLGIIALIGLRYRRR